MPDPATKPHTIKFAVAVSGRQPAQPEAEALESSLKQSIHTLLADLHIPARFALSLEFSEAKSLTGPVVSVSIHGEKCRIPYVPQGGGDISGKTIASTIMEIVHRNRALLINQAIARSIGETTSSEAGTSRKKLPPTELHRLLTTLVQRGFSVRRWVDFTPDVDASGWTYLQYYDAILAAVDATTIRVVYNLAYHQLNARTSAEALREMFALRQEGLFYELGVVFPQIEWAVDESLADNEFHMQINDVHYPPAFGLKPGEILVNDTAERLLLLNIEGRPAINPANGQECAIVDEAHSGVCEEAGLTTWNPLGYLILYLSQQLRQQAGSFLTRDVVAHDLDALSLAFPVLVETVVRRYDLGMLTWILRELLDEALSIRDLRAILDNLLLVNGTIRVELSQYIVLYPEGAHLIPSGRALLSDLSFADYADYVRATALKRYISHKYTRGANTLLVYLLDPKIEARLREVQGRQLPVAERNEVIDAVYSEVGNLPPTARIPVILTTHEIRRQFRKLVEVEFPHLAVLSYQELSPAMNIQPIARIGTKQLDRAEVAFPCVG